MFRFFVRYQHRSRRKASRWKKSVEAMLSYSWMSTAMMLALYWNTNFEIPKCSAEKQDFYTFPFHRIFLLRTGDWTMYSIICNIYVYIVHYTATPLLWEYLSVLITLRQQSSLSAYKQHIPTDSWTAQKLLWNKLNKPQNSLRYRRFSFKTF